MRHIWQQTLPHITHQWTNFVIENARNYHRKTEHTAEQQYLSIHIDTSKITGCRIYESAFWYKHVLSHCMLGFIYTDSHGEEKELILSIEARRPAWEKYSLWKGIIPAMYEIIYTRWTPGDLLALRKHIRRDPLVSYTLNLPPLAFQKLFTYFAHRTNKIYNKPISYHAIRYNCLTDLHRWLSASYKKLFSFTIRTIIPRWYIWYLKRKWLIKG